MTISSPSTGKRKEWKEGNGNLHVSHARQDHTLLVRRRINSTDVNLYSFLPLPRRGPGAALGAKDATHDDPLHAPLPQRLAGCVGGAVGSGAGCGDEDDVCRTR